MRTKSNNVNHLFNQRKKNNCIQYMYISFESELLGIPSCLLDVSFLGLQREEKEIEKKKKVLEGNDL